MFSILSGTEWLQFSAFVTVYILSYLSNPGYFREIHKNVLGTKGNFYPKRLKIEKGTHSIWLLSKYANFLFKAKR
jgi:hypothetical protein